MTPVTYFRVSTAVSIRGENICSEYKAPVRKSNTRIKGAGERFEGPNSTFAPDALERHSCCGKGKTWVLTEWRGRPQRAHLPARQERPPEPSATELPALGLLQRCFPWNEKAPGGDGAEGRQNTAESFSKAQWLRKEPIGFRKLSLI